MVFVPRTARPVSKRAARVEVIGLQSVRVDPIDWTIGDVTIQIHPTRFPDRVAADPAADLGIIRAEGGERESGCRMDVVSGEAEGAVGRRALEDGSASVRIVAGSQE
jgi:hypothetical protein